MAPTPPPIWYDVTDTLKSGRRTGIQRVVIELARELQLKVQLNLIRFDPWTGKFFHLTRDEETRFWESTGEASIAVASRRFSFTVIWSNLKGIVVPWIVQPLFRRIRPREDRQQANLTKGTYLCAEILGDPVRNQAVRRVHRRGLVETVHVLYDFLPLTHPEWTTLNPRDFARHWNLVRTGSLLVAISEHTRSEAELRRGSSLTPIVVAYPGLNFAQSPQGPRDLKIGHPFFASIGTVEDRKNQRLLLQAFVAYRDQGGEASLIVAGGAGRGSDSFQKELHALQDRGYPVEWWKTASDGQVAALYEQARATIYISLAEGYGLPVLESLGRGTPCITADRTSTGEIARVFGGCVLVDPNNPSEVSQAMRQFDREPEHGPNLIRSLQLPLPTWEQFASTILGNSGQLRLLVDVSILGYSELNAQYRTGIFQVASALLKALSKQPGVKIGAYSSSGNLFLCRRALRKSGLEALPMVGGFWTSHLSFVVLVFRNLLFKAGQKGAAALVSKILDLNMRWRAAGDRKALSEWQAYLSPMDSVPEWIAKDPGMVSAALIHDLIPLILPEYAQDTSDPTRWFTRLMLSVRPSARYFTVSEFTRQDFLTRFPALTPENVTVAPNAVDRSRFVPGLGTPPVRPFFLVVSTIEPRKRIDTAVAGFIHYRQSGGLAELVICGANRRGHQEQILRDIDASVRPHIRFPGYVRDEDLPGLYGQCMAFISLSEYEGFGLPILEAMSCGAPVIVSKRTSHPEVAGEAGVYVEPDDSMGVSLAMLRMEADPGWRSFCSSRSLSCADRYSWDKTAAIITSRFIREGRSGS